MLGVVVLNDWLKIIISFLSGIVAIYIRELIIQLMKRRSDIKKSYELANIFIFSELRNNYDEYVRESTGGGITFQHIFEINSTGVSLLEDIELHTFERKFNNSGWVSIKNKMVEMNFKLSKEISDVYFVFEYLIQHTNKKTKLEKLDLLVFDGFSTKCKTLIDKINIESPKR